MKTTIKHFVLAVAACLMAACQSSGIHPVSEKIQGPLGSYFVVVDKAYKVVDGKVAIELKRIDDGFPRPWTEGMQIGYSGGTCEPLFSIEFQDGNGSVVAKARNEIATNQKELETLAALRVGEAATLTFKCPKETAMPAKFKMSSTFKVHTKGETIISDIFDDFSNLFSIIGDIGDDDDDDDF